ncbi:hypothetical protein IT575_02335 [bacterium]|nr:hypothetical protein [bacterium]
MDIQPTGADYLVSYGEELRPAILDVAWELKLNVPIEVAWRKVILEVNNWWSHCYKDGSVVLMEAFPGGRFWERFADGVNGAIYASVVYCEPPYVLKCMGNWAMPGIGQSSGVWRFSEQDGVTHLKSTGQMLGVLDVNLMKERRGGTQSLISSLARWVEQDEIVERARQ